MSSKVSLQKKPNNSVRTEQPFIQVQLKHHPSDKTTVSTRIPIDHLFQYFEYQEHLKREAGVIDADDFRFPPNNFNEFITEFRDEPLPTTNTES